MKHIFSLFCISILLLFTACSIDSGGSDSPTIPNVIKTFSGSIEKGALQKGATITASEWSPATGYSGKVYTSETLDNKGGYEITSSELTGLLDIKADGFFINENSGTVENTRIILSGLVDSSQSGGNINIVTHIIKQRVIALINSGKDFSTATNQATTELYSKLNWIPENPLNTNISTNSKLLFLSAALCKNRTVSEVSNILTALTADMADGNVDLSVLNDSFSLVDIAGVTANMNAVYGICPDIAPVKSQILTDLAIEDSTVRQVTMIPVTAAEFYMYGNGQLKGLVSGSVSDLNIAYVQKYLGVTETVNTTINEFFSITSSGVKTLYFKVTFPYDSSFKYYKQVSGTVSEIASLPTKPVKTMIPLFTETDSLGFEYVTTWDNCTEPGQETLYNQRIQLYDNGSYIPQGMTYSMIKIDGVWTAQEVWVEDYYVFNEFIYNGVNYKNGILLKWSNGKMMFIYADASFNVNPIDVDYLDLGSSWVMW